MTDKTLRIAAGCSADITLSMPQMAGYGEIDYLVLDYLMEHSIAKMAGARAANPMASFGAGLLGPEVMEVLPDLMARGIRIMTNAGGLDPLLCARLFREAAGARGLAPRIAVVHGDDVLDQLPGDFTDMFSGAPVPGDLLSANAYLGAQPIAEALRHAPDIVITGRVVDSALTLGALIHEFGWALDDFHRLGTGSIIGHLLECGAQPSGGIHTDWQQMDFANPSFPIAEVSEDGSAVFFKVPGTGGRITRGTLGEQLTYEIGDPQRYFLPDVTADFSAVTLQELGPDRIRLSGGTGHPPTATYKVCAMQQLGWRAVLSNPVVGKDATGKARKIVAALLRRSEVLNARHNWGPLDQASAQYIGTGESMGAHAPAGATPSEVVYRLVADHPRREAMEALMRVHGGTAASMAPGTPPPLGADIRPRMKLWSFLMEKSRVQPLLSIDDRTLAVGMHDQAGYDSAALPPCPGIPPHPVTGTHTVPLERLAYLRSGDKGDLVNIGVVARDPAWLPWLSAALTPEVIRDWYAHLFADPAHARVDRYEMPGLGAFNFVLHDALDGGAVSSRRFDDMGKGLGQQLLDLPVRVPEGLLAAPTLQS
ncbi:acyclic terpene utilization AtuA family protein [Acidimangrovimonas sediminis]|uniref:acyclic terpene utilization AtuA family protein n=1 Tax=Acidimangrovimonas sediminis TaxID=2056283 RepID=UPI000C80EE7A|nr:acyclic terpene utilization AtuA family protein [Acidimangrovimonas sediminis]